MDDKHHTNWFESWFDSNYYHILYKHRSCDEAEEFIDKLVTFFNPQKHARCLDLACGKGRHSVFLNKKGLDVTGIDLSPESIKFASQFENDELHFYVHDMRKLFRTNYFDYTVNLFTSFGYFENERDDLATMDAVTKGLKPGGMFVIDFFNEKKVLANLKPYYDMDVEGIHFTIAKKEENGIIIKHISFTDKGKNYQFEERVKALSLKHFENYFNTCGLKIVQLWGDYNLGAFDLENSDRLIIVAQKQPV
ncbi:MAG: Methyltransferase type 11 [Bacteroidetes bacterium]|nr:Methyltransferase type 11 [Bacteroidota bacterium]